MSTYEVVKKLGLLFLPAALIGRVLVAPLAAQSAAPVRVVAITFDDLPYVHAGEVGSQVSLAIAAEANRRILSTLRHFHAPATGFVIESRIRAIGPGAEQLLAGWNRDDYELGIHSFSHADANTLDIAGFEQEIVQGEVTIGPMTQRSGRRLRFFRFPFNHLGDSAEKQTAIMSFLASRGYKIAASTIDTSDYVFDAAFERALRERDNKMQEQIKRSYLDHTKKQIAYYAALNQQVLGFDPPAIMLLHLSRLNATTLASQLALFRKSGYSFVSLATAQSHPVYAEPLRSVTRFGPMWGYRWARDRHVRFDGSREEEAPDWVADYGAGKSVVVPKKNQQR